MGSSAVPAHQIGGSVPFTANIFPSLNTTLTAVTAATGVKSELVAHMHDEGGSASPAAFSSGKACGEGSQLVSPLFKQQHVDHADSSHLRDFRESASSSLSFGQQWTHDQQPFNLVASQPAIAQADTSAQPVPTVPQLGAGWAIDSFLHSLEDSEPSAGSDTTDKIMAGGDRDWHSQDFPAVAVVNEVLRFVLPGPCAEGSSQTQAGMTLAAPGRMQLQVGCRGSKGWAGPGQLRISRAAATVPSTDVTCETVVLADRRRWYFGDCQVLIRRTPSQGRLKSRRDSTE
eukprot:CAMPEP_0202809584 /NCGR_PEP_ID=MMETSP1389-20130828/1871_1 /ASSEMBLY_ACC=CAM_ASM_000865 /TAXON_ID=302021 /ORGANISM="Rhodomonas sp., Strain CCMP768" /LENGTH=286 /DNA_ID=CAMNT_0049480241 /DNA_START=471 /DNA_END=1333 /DNA_ORIENTATION=-